MAIACPHSIWKCFEPDIQKSSQLATLKTQKWVKNLPQSLSVVFFYFHRIATYKIPGCWCGQGLTWGAHLLRCLLKWLTAVLGTKGLIHCDTERSATRPLTQLPPPWPSTQLLMNERNFQRKATDGVQGRPPQDIPRRYIDYLKFNRYCWWAASFPLPRIS